MENLNRRKFLKLAGAAPLGLAARGIAPSKILISPSLRNLAEPWLDINLRHVAWNLAQIRRRVDNRPIMAVIKANAYGHGLVEVGKFLEKQNIDFLAVGKCQEAFQLREKGVKTPILESYDDQCDRRQ